MMNSRQSARNGNTIVMVLGIVVLVASILLVSSQLSSASAKAVSSGGYQQLALSAAEAVAIRQETTIATLAGAGDPSGWVDMTEVKIAGNYGENWLGNCRVRWKVEPAVTAGVSSDTVEGWNYIVNPPPDTTATTTAPQVVNDGTYLFRISAEATYFTGATSSATVLARAQSVRFASVDKIPLLRYVIFYAKNGPKGDLEFSHGPGVKIRGNVHSNGAIYLGGGTQVNDYTALLRSAGGIVPVNIPNPDPLEGEDANATVIGPDQFSKSVRICGVDGIFRLSKQLGFTAFNGFPFSGVSPGGSPGTSWYSNVSAPAPGETGAKPNYPTPDFAGANLAARTYEGRIINPSRITDSAALSSRDIDPADQLRKINGVYIRGFTPGYLGSADSAASSASKANDSRDVTRTNYTWKVNSLGSSAPGFSGYSRSIENGGKSVALAKAMQYRPFEAQAIAQPTYTSGGIKATLTDGVTPNQTFPQDNPVTPSTDEEENHWEALPLFMKSDGTDTAMIPTTGAIVEKPGAQLRNALGRTDTFMTRRVSPFTGWDITKINGTTAPGPDPQPVGLIIRERPVPDPAIAGSLAYPSSLSPDYMPYVYGKPRPAMMPFLPINVADSMSYFENDQAVNGTNDPFTFDLSPFALRQTYSQGGQLAFSVANREGPAQPAPQSGYQRTPKFFRGNWRFFNLKSLRSTSADVTNPTYASGINGLRATYFFNQSFTGKAHIQNDANINYNWGSTPPILNSGPSGFQSINYSVRWEGQITAPSTGSYIFSAIADDVCRIWVDGIRVLNQPAFVSTGFRTSGQSISLKSGESYPFVVEFVQGGGSAVCQVFWSHPTSGGDQIIPLSAFHTPFGTQISTPATFRRESFFRLNDFQSVQMRVKDFTNVSAPNAKVALMIQDGANGSSPMASGRAPYAAIAYSPARGFFLEYRGLPSNEQTVSVNLSYVGSGDVSGVPDPLGQVFVSPTAPSVTRTSTLTHGTALPDVIGPITNENNLQPYDVPSFSINYTKPTNPWSTSEGIVNEVVLGPVETTLRRYPLAYSRSRRSRTTIWSIGGSALMGPFKDGTPAGSIDDRQSWISLYTNATGGAQPTPSQVSPGWTFDLGLGEIRKTDTLFTSANGDYNNPLMIWGTFSQASQTFGTSKTIYPPYPRYYLGGTPGRVADAAETLAYMNSLYGGGFSLASPGDMPVYVDPGAPTFTAGLPPNVDADLPPAYALGTSTYSIPRTISPVIDCNSYVTRGNPWFPTPKSQWLPRPLGYSAWADAGVTSALMPKANSFAPNAWSSANWLPSALPALPIPPADGAGVVPLVGSPRWSDDLPTGAPPAISASNQIWLRIARDGSTNKVKFFYYVGPETPVPVATDFIPLQNGAEDVEYDLSSFGSDVTYSDPAAYDPSDATRLNFVRGNASDRQLLIGPAMQSGTTTYPSTATVSDIEVEMNVVTAGLDKWNASKWEDSGATGPSQISRYLASQYQVFFGSEDITEDFFTYNQANAATRVATEDWIYNPREFWSQSKWWDPDLGRSRFKESTTQGPGEANFLPGGGICQRELYAKMTLLTLNFRELQNYLKNRTLDQARTKTITALAVPPTIGVEPTLASKFNKLIYAARCNRYPVNPLNLRPNPWNTDLPNNSDDFKDLGLATDAATKAMQPYTLPYAPSMRSQQFFQGVRIINGGVIDWERGGVTPKFGNSKLTVVTPNQMFIQGDFNYSGGTWPAVEYKNLPSDTSHPTPVAIMADAVTFLSSAFQDSDFKVPGLVTDAAGSAITGGGTLALGSALPLPVASDTHYYFSLVTNNQPTTKDSVQNGEAASFINEMEYLENWSGKKMTYSGSLVVLDTRRYSSHYVLDRPKEYGWGPFGFHRTAAADPAWMTTWGLAGYPAYNNPGMPLPYVQGAPNRSLTFNYDLLTEAGTPPFVPFGVSVAGRGGWNKIIE